MKKFLIFPILASQDKWSKTIKVDPASKEGDYTMIVNYKYLVLGNHPIFRYINKYCFTIKEANKIKDELETIGYEVEIKEEKIR